MKILNPETICDICGRKEYKSLFVKEGFRHVMCTECGMVYVNPLLIDHLDQQRDSGTGSMGDESLSRKQRFKLKKQLEELEKYRLLNRMAEIGPGRGWFLLEAGKTGWERWAIEVNKDALKRLEQIALEKIITDPAECMSLPEDHFDVIRMWDVIEHLQSPRAAVTRIFTALRPGGLLNMSTTNFNSLSRMVNGPEWVYLNGSDHIHLFDPITIKILLERIGFTQVVIHTRSFNLRRKLYHPEQELPIVNPIWIPFRKLIDELIRFTNYGHQMIIKAQKPK